MTDWITRLKKCLGLHVWKWHNPYSRTCKVCGISQQVYVRSWAMSSPGWWERMIAREDPQAKCWEKPDDE